MERDEARADATEAQTKLGEVQEQLASMSDRSLSALISYLAPDSGPVRDRADLLLKVRSLDALPESEAAVNLDSERHAQYKRAVMTMVDGLVAHAAHDDRDRVAVLEFAIHHHLERRLRGKRDSSGAAKQPPVESLLNSIANMWRNAKRVNDYVGARQALSLLILPERRQNWTHADIAALVSEVKEINVGDRVLVDVKRRNSRAVGIITAVGDGVFDVAPVDVPARSRISCGVMMGVPARKVEHCDSLICRLGEASGRCACARHATCRRVARGDRSVG